MTEARLTIEAEEKHEDDGFSGRPRRRHRLQRLAIGMVITSAILVGALKLLFRRR